MQQTGSRAQSAFTLIELSIVLVIIGLIVGGILVGRDLIRAAGVRATISDVEQIRTGINAFRTKYNCLPGDCTNATDYFGTSAACPNPDANGTCNGNGDGSYLPWFAESALAGDHLIRAQLWKFSNQPSAQPYALKIRGLVSEYSFGTIFTNDPWTSGAPVAGHDGIAVTLTAITKFCINGTALSASSAQSLDTKIDDGRAATGAVTSADGGLPNSPTPACGDPAPLCLASGEYDLIHTDAQCRTVVY